MIYQPGTELPVGGSKTHRDGDEVAIVAAAITLHEALEAAGALAEDGISARMIDCYSVKPIDADTLASLSMIAKYFHRHLWNRWSLRSIMQGARLEQLRH